MPRQNRQAIIILPTIIIRMAKPEVLVLVLLPSTERATCLVNYQMLNPMTKLLIFKHHHETTTFEMELNGINSLLQPNQSL
jgi:hypothetical protein